MNKILLGDNQELFRIGVAKILASEEDFRLAAQCADLERLLLSIDAYRSSIVLFASALRPEYQNLMARVKAAGSRAVVIAENGEAAHTFFAHDIRGVVYRNTVGEELVECLHRVIKGQKSIERAGEAIGLDEEDFHRDAGSRSADPKRDAGRCPAHARFQKQRDCSSPGHHGTGDQELSAQYL